MRFLAIIILFFVPYVSFSQCSPLSKEEIKTMKSMLAAKMQRAIDNLQDESIPFSQVYTLWKDKPAIIAELIILKKYFETNAVPVNPSPFLYVPSPQDFENKLFKKNPCSARTISSKDPKKLQTTVTDSTDLFKQFLLEWQRETKAELGYYYMDLAYKQGWRNLEMLYTQSVLLANQITDSMKPCIPTCGFVGDKANQKLMAELAGLTSSTDNAVLNLLNTSYYKKWVWYTEGLLFMNPLGATVKDLRYPADEKIAQLTDEQKKDSLTAADEDALFEKLITTKKVRSEKVTPGAQYGKLHNYIEYDAATKYQPITNLDHYILDNEHPFSVIIHNVSASETLTITTDKSSNLKDESTITSDIVNAGSLFDAVGIPAAIAAFKKLNSSLNGVPPSMVSPTLQFSGLTSPNSRSSNSRKNLQYFSRGFERSLSNKSSENGILVLDKDVATALYVTINDRKIFAEQKQDEDKAAFIKAGGVFSSSSSCKACRSSIPECLITEFIKRDKCYVFSYNDTEKDPLINLKKETDMLFCRFRIFVAEIKSCRDELQITYDKLTKTYIPLLKSLTSIVKRSLPAREITEKTNNEPDFRTVILTPGLTPPKNVVYEVTSTLPAKRVDGKDAGTTNVVIQQSFKFAKRHHIGVSAGLAYTVSDYTTTDIESNLPKIINGDKFRPIVGLHIYPIKGLLNIDDRLTPQWSRLSLFLGLGLTSSALNNFYPAISYDVVPGIKAMAGVHFYKDTRYTIANNAIVNQASAYRSAGIFFALNLEPAAFASFIGLVK